MSRVDNATADVIVIAGRVFYVLQFPTDGKTLVYDMTKKQPEGWAEWGYYNTSTGVHEGFRGSMYTYANDWGFHLWGDRSTGKVYKMKDTLYQDDGGAIKTIRKTGHIDHGTSLQKVNRCVRIRSRRGDLAGSVPKILIRWNLDNFGWSDFTCWIVYGSSFPSRHSADPRI